MRKSLLTLIGAAAIAIAPVTAGAVTYDFTDSSKYGPLDPSDTQNVGGNLVTATLSGNGPLSFTTFDGDASVASLAFDYDGVGIYDDEISTGGEAVTVTFSETVAVIGFSFLDLFFADGQTDSEFAEVYLEGALVYTFFADLVFQESGGYKYASVSPLLTDQLVFLAGAGNDGVGVADYALAAIDVQAVPLPASLVLLLSALGCLGIVSRRKAAT